MSENTSVESVQIDAVLNEAVLQLLSLALRRHNYDVTLSKVTLETPPERSWGDLAFPCFALAQELKKSPVEIAALLGSTIQELLESDTESVNLFSSVASQGPYVNFFLNPRALNALLELHGAIPRYRSTGSTVLLEYISPNTNKPLHLGHLRNAMIGDVLARVLEYSGNTVIRCEVINDRGIHICKSMLAYMIEHKNTGKTPTPESTGEKGDHFVGNYYVQFEKLLKEDPEIINHAQELLQKWEEGDTEVRALWSTMNGWTLKGHEETYTRLGIAFDKVYLESDIYRDGQDRVLEAEKKGIFVRDDKGNLIAPLESHGFENKTVLRADGTAVYATQDIALALHKQNDFHADQSLYVVGSEQNLYLKQLFAILTMMGYSWADTLRHVSYGLVNLPEGRMKSREGTVVDIDDLLNTMEQELQEEIVSREELVEQADKELRAELLTRAALRYFFVHVDPASDVTFDPKESIAIHGNTGPYLLYTATRLKSILHKAEEQGIVAQHISHDSYSYAEEKKLLFILAQYAMILENACTALDPSKIAKYCYELAQAANEYYHRAPILQEENPIRDARLQVVAQVHTVLIHALGLLGIIPVNKM